MTSILSEHPRGVPLESSESQGGDHSTTQPFLTRFIEPQGMAGGTQTYYVSDGGTQDIKWDPD
ncbi:MAG: hypothetical protein WD579_00385 [Candidatus Paceibacterota bacterium]